MATTSAGAQTLTSLRGYRIDRFLERGPSGMLYLAHSDALPGRVALKAFAPGLAEDERFRERFLEDARIVAGIGHPGIIPIHEVDLADGVLFVAMRLVEGSDLRTMLGAGPLSDEQALRVIEQTAGALHAAHTSGIVHRDLKPSNILLESLTHRVYVTDLALRPTVADYCAPEVLARMRADGRADVYSLGVVLLECLTGRVARDANAAPEWLHAVIAKATAEDPADRYTTTVELVDELREALASRPQAPPPPPAPAAPEPAPPAPAAVAPPPAEPEEPEPDPPKRSRKRLVIAAALVAAAVAAGLLLVGRGGGTHHSSPPAPAEPLLPRVSARLQGIVPLQRTLTERLRATPVSIRRIESAAAPLADRLGSDEGWVSTLHPRTQADRALTSTLTSALVAHAAYAASLANLAPATSISKAQADVVVAKAGRAERAYERMAATAPTLAAMPLSADDDLRLIPTPAAVIYDRVANTGGVGVRFRTSPRFWCGSAPKTDPCWKSVVPGAGAAEGTRLRIYCYVRGAAVHGDTWWAQVATGPDEYVPATFLAAGHTGRPLRAASC